MSDANFPKPTTSAPQIQTVQSIEAQMSRPEQSKPRPLSSFMEEVRSTITVLFEQQRNAGKFNLDLIKLESTLENDCTAIHAAASWVRTIMPSKWAIDATICFRDHLRETSAIFAQFLDGHSLATFEDQQATAEWLASKDGKIHTKCNELWKAMPHRSTMRKGTLDRGRSHIASPRKSSDTAVSFANDVVDHISTHAGLALKAIPAHENYVTHDERERRAVLSGLSERGGVLCDARVQLLAQYHSSVLDPSMVKLRPILQQYESLNDDLSYANNHLPAGTLEPNEGPDLLDAYLTKIRESVGDHGYPENVTRASRRILGLRSGDASGRQAFLAVLSLTAPPKGTDSEYGKWFETIQTRFATRTGLAGKSEEDGSEASKGASITGCRALTRMPSHSGSAIVKGSDMSGRKKPRKIQIRAGRSEAGASSAASSHTADRV